MRELPSHGRCHAAFLLAFSASLKEIRDVEEWVAAASNRASFLAAAGDVTGTARLLLSAGLVHAEERITLGPQLAKLSQKADRASLVAIARLFLLRYPPSWIPSAVIDGQVVIDLIPSQHLDRLSWLGPDLVPLILEVHRTLLQESDEVLRRQIGHAGELVVMSALVQAGFDPVHVSLLSDSYGYDIDYADQGSTKRIEVKSAVKHTAGRLLVSRNEFDKSLLFQDSWRVVQVVFSTNVILRKRVEPNDIIMIRELKSGRLRALSPPPSTQFSWVESAEFRPNDDDWTTSTLIANQSINIRLDV